MKKLLLGTLLASLLALLLALLLASPTQASGGPTPQRSAVRRGLPSASARPAARCGRTSISMATQTVATGK
jgi:hypothetical protein